MADLSLAELESFDPKARRNSGERRFCCPPCGRGKPRDAAHRSLAVNSDTGAWICHRCGEKGILKEFRDKHKPNGSWKGGRTVDPRLEVSEPKEQDQLDLEKAENLLTLRKGLRKYDGSDADIYLQGRGIPTMVAKAAGVKFAPNWAGHPAVVFPIVDRDLKLVAATGRYIDGAMIKTRTYGSKKNGVFMTSGKSFSANPVVITEAPIDALSLATVGLPSISLCGITKAGECWPEWLPASLVGRRVFIAFDADGTGDQAAKNLADTLRTWDCQIYRLRPPYPHKDWNEMLHAGESSRLSTIAATVSSQV